MRLAIIGSQEKAFTSEAQIRVAKRAIEMILNHHLIIRSDVETFISGGASGIDSWTEALVDIYGMKKVIHLPRTSDWPGYKTRNILIAQDCDVLYAIRAQAAKTFGSAWTADYAESIGKEVYRYVV